MPKRARYFSAAVIAVAALTAALVLPRTDWTHVPRAPFVVLLALQVLLMLTIRLPMQRENPAGPAMISVLLAAIVLLPPGAAALTGAVASAFMVLRRGDPWRVALSGSVTFLAAAAGGLTYRAVHGGSTLTAADFPRALLPIGLAVLVLSSVPAVLLSGFLVHVGQLTPRAAFREYALRSGPRNVGYAFVGLLTAVLWSVSYDALAAIVLLGPVVVTRWATVQYEEQREAHDAIIRTLVQAVEIKDLYTRGHSERVAKVSGMIAAELRLPEDRVEVLTYAATLHDVGKLGVPTRLLRKTDRLDDHEFEEIRLHPSRGVEVVRDIAFLDEAYSAILHHHERMDGLGYPSGLRGMRIPPFARIIAVADAFDSMTSTRSYRGARGSDEALTELRANMGSQFDPEIVDAIAAALARAELAGNPWRGDGTSYEEGPDGRARLADLPPGAVVAEFDHDDPAYQLLAVAEAEGREKPASDDFASGGGAPGVESLGDGESAGDGEDGRDGFRYQHGLDDDGDFGIAGCEEERSGCEEAPAHAEAPGSSGCEPEVGPESVGRPARPVRPSRLNQTQQSGQQPVVPPQSSGRLNETEQSGQQPVVPPQSSGWLNETEQSGQQPVVPSQSSSRLNQAQQSGQQPVVPPQSSGWVNQIQQSGQQPEVPPQSSGRLNQAQQPGQQPAVPPQSRLPRSLAAPDQAAGVQDGLRLAPYGAGFTVPTQAKRAPDLDGNGSGNGNGKANGVGDVAAEPDSVEQGAADPETESR